MSRAARPCPAPRCPELVTAVRPCPHHARAYDRKRPNAARRGYDSAWRRIRERHLQANPFCEWCGEVATEVDHIDGNPRNNAPSNHRSACKPCHSRRTATEQGFARGRAR